MKLKRMISMILAMVLMVSCLEMTPMAALAENVVVTDNGDGTTTIVRQQELEPDVASPEEISALPSGYLLEKSFSRSVDEPEMQSGEWQYRLDEHGYAVITGVDAPDAVNLTVPAVLDGHAVYAVGADAFAGVTGLRTLTIPANVVSIHPNMLGALRTKVTVRAYNGTAAMQYADRYMVAFENLSAFEFLPNVIDFSGARSGAVKVIDSNTLCFDPLEGSQLEVGSVFYLAGTGEGHRVLTLTRQDGGIVVTTEEPAARDVVSRVRVDLSNLKVDPSQCEWAEGVTMVSYEEKFTEEYYVPIFSPTLELKWESSKDPKPGETYVKIEGTAKLDISITGVIDVDVLALQINECSVTATIGIEIDTEISAAVNLITIPLGKIPVAEAGVASVDVRPKLELEAAVSLKVTYDYKREIGFKWDSNTSEFVPFDRVVSERDISVEGSLTLSLKPSIDIEIAFLGEIASLSVALGVKATAARSYLNIKDTVDVPTGDAETDYGAMTTNCMDLTVSLFVKATAEFNLLDILDLKFPIVDISFKIIEEHMERRHGLAKTSWHFVKECTYNSDNYVSVFIDRNDGTPVEHARTPKNKYLSFNPKINSRPGYLPEGWYTDEAFTQKLDPSAEVTQDLYLYLKWLENGQYLVVHDQRQGNKTIPVSGGTMLKDVISEENRVLEYQFLGWYLDPEYTQRVELSSAVMPNETLNIYAKWQYKEGYNPFTSEQCARLLTFKLNSDWSSYSIVGCHPEAQAMTIPDVYNGKPVTDIAASAFENCTKLRIVDFGDNIRTVGNKAFAGCTAMTHLRMNHGLASLGSEVFSGCSALTGINIPSTVTKCGTSVFIDCSAMTSATIPTSWTALPTETFRRCASLTSIPLHEGLEKIGDSAFRGCDALTTVTIPSTVTTIGAYAYSYCDKLTSFTFPDTVTTIGNYALAGCVSITNVKLPVGMTRLPSFLCKNCTSLTTIIWPDAPAFVSAGAFQGCTSLAVPNIPATVGSIEESAFQGCTALTELTLHEGLVTLGKAALSGTSLTSFTVPTTVTKLSESVLENCTKLTSLTLHEGVVVIQKKALANTALSSFDFPVTLKTIGTGMLSGCKKLTEVSIPDHWKILPGSTFEGCSSLGSIVLPSKLVEIGGSCFKGCSLLKSITLPDTVTTLGDSCFYGSGLTGLTVPPLVTVLPMFAVAYCHELEYITLPAGLTEIGAFAMDDCTALTKLFIPYGVTTIGGFAFCGNRKLADLWMPPTVTSIGSFAFQSTSSVASNIRVLIHCEPDSFAAAYATKKGIAWEAYTYEVPETTTTDKNTQTTSDGFVYEIIETGAKIVGYEGNVTRTLDIPDTLGGAPVVAIGPNAMTGDFTAVRLPASLAEVDPTAFVPAQKMTRFYMDAGNEHFQVQNYALYTLHTTPVTLVACPRGFSGTYTVPGNVEAIGENAFSGCLLLTSVKLSATVTDIQPKAFADCTALTSVTLNSGLLTIGDLALFNCTALKKLTIPDTVTEIAGNAITNCDMSIYGAVGECVASEFAKKSMAPYNMYTVTYIFEGMRLDSRQTQAGALLSAPFTPEEEYKTFDGWYTTDKYKTLWDYEAGVMPAKNMSLYGRWTSDFTASVSSGKATITGYAGDKGVLVIPPLFGSAPVTAIKAGALCSTEEAPILSVTIPNSVTTIGEGALAGVTIIVGDSGSAAEAYAAANGIAFEIRTYTLRFACGKGTPAADQQLAAGAVFTLPEPVLDNHRLCGWFLDDEYVTELTELVMPASDMALYALWARIDGAFQDDLFTYAYVDGGVSITGYNGVAHELVIPDTINGLPVTSISDGAFRGNSTLVKVVLPDSITTVGAYAFSSTSLSEINLGSGVTMLGEYAFADCRLLNELAIPPLVAQIPEGLLQGCIGIRELAIGDQVTAIGKHAFNGMSRLKSVQLGSGVESIGDAAFDNCTKLEALRLPASLSHWGNAVLIHCKALASLTVDEKNEYLKADGAALYTADGNTLLAYAAASPAASFTAPEGVTMIAPYAFAEAKNLVSLTLPSTLASIGSHAFEQCLALRECTFAENCLVTELPAYAFASCTQLQNINLPAGLAIIAANAFRSDAALTFLELSADMLSIDASAFEGCLALTLCSEEGSYVQDYANLNGLGFQTPDATVKVTLISLPLTAELQMNEFRRLQASALPLTAENRALTWMSTDTGVVEVTQDGLVKPIAEGTADVIVSAADGSGTTATCRVTVSGTMTAFALPHALVRIEEEAFAGLPVRYVSLNGTACTDIESRAFADCSLLRRVDLPDTVADIAADAFGNSERLIIVCNPGSAAAAFAEANGIAWVGDE